MDMTAPSIGFESEASEGLRFPSRGFFIWEVQPRDFLIIRRNSFLEIDLFYRRVRQEVT
jgi:hypothetical protein